VTVRLSGLDFMFNGAGPSGPERTRAARAARAKATRLREVADRALDLCRRYRQGDPRGDAADAACDRANTVAARASIKADLAEADAGTGGAS